MFNIVPVTNHGVNVLAVVGTSTGTDELDSLVGDPTGTIWTFNSQTAPITSAYVDLTYAPSLGKFIALGNPSVTAVTSDYGATWTGGTDAPGSRASLCWSEERAVCVGVGPAGGTDPVLISSDGLAFSEHTNPGAGARVTRTCYSPELDMFLFSNNNAINPISDTKVFRSTDGGQNWSNNQPFGAGNRGITSICWSPELGIFCAITGNANGVGFYRLAWLSEDGVNWTSYTTIAEDIPFGQVIWAKELGLFVAISGRQVGAGLSSDSNAAATSPDGQTWTKRTLPYTREWVSVCFTGRVCIALIGGGTDADNAAVSSDGITWNSVALPQNRNWSIIAAARNQF